MKIFFAAIIAAGVLGWAVTASAQIPKLAELPDSLPPEVRVELANKSATLARERADLLAKTKAFNDKCNNVTVGTTLEKECEKEFQQLETERAAYSLAANSFNELVKQKGTPAPGNFNPATLFLDSSVVDLRDITNRTVDPAKVREGPFKSSFIQFSQPEQMVLANPVVTKKAAALGQRWSDDPRYKEIQKRWRDTKDMALLFGESPSTAQENSYWAQIRNFYTLKAQENHRSAALQELRKNSDAMNRASEQIEAEEKQRITQLSGEWGNDLKKAMADPQNRKGLNFTDPEIIGPLANRATREFNTKVATVETLTQVKYLDAAHQIVTKGNTQWTPADFMLETAK